MGSPANSPSSANSGCTRRTADCCHPGYASGAHAFITLLSIEMDLASSCRMLTLANTEVLPNSNLPQHKLPFSDNHTLSGKIK